MRTVSLTLNTPVVTKKKDAEPFASHKDFAKIVGKDSGGQNTRSTIVSANLE